MTDDLWLAERFETHRSRIRSVAYRILGSLGDAEDAVQETWLRFHRTDMATIDNVGGWLTTVTARICLDMLRARTTRREESLTTNESAAMLQDAGMNPEDEAVLTDSLGLALLIVLDVLSPAERVAFVLHDVFGVSLAQVAPIVNRTPAATRQLASRARRRVRFGATVPPTDLHLQRKIVDAFLAASRTGDVVALLALLDPNVSLHADAVAAAWGSPREVRGAEAVAAHFDGRAREGTSMLINGAVGIVIAPQGQLRLVLRLTIVGGRIRSIVAVGEPTQLEALEITTIDA